MKRTLFGISLAAVLCLGLAIQAGAQDKKKESRVEGRVQVINKDRSEIVVQRSSARRTITYNSNTKWTKLNKPGSMDDVKEGYRVICVGVIADKKFVASQCDARGN